MPSKPSDLNVEVGCVCGKLETNETNETNEHAWQEQQNSADLLLPQGNENNYYYISTLKLLSF